MQIAEPATNDPATSTAAPKVDIRALSPGEDATPFRTLNEEWITRYFALEPTDIETLGDPETKILRKGGQIFMVYIDSQPIGCVALIPTGPGVYELSKMAVAPAMRGLGIGRRLLEYAVARARAMGAKSLFLGSNSILKSAVHLYESIGFQHVPAESLPDIHYSRSDVFMTLEL